MKILEEGGKGWLLEDGREGGILRTLIFVFVGRAMGKELRMEGVNVRKMGMGL